MQSLRNAPIIARLVLAWFALSVGVSIASPLIEPLSAHLVCSVGGTKMVLLDDEGSEQKAKAGLDCPLCVPVAPTSLATSLAFASPSGLSHALRPTVAAHLAWVTRSPLPPRGPPVRS
ncbi:MAG: DUF2946 family protein [Burkholderiaceae bacterium]|nr:DUF2946 family protein [Burkholderiaceae bacterium]